VVLGHTHLETTMNYLHPEAGRVASPLKGYAAAPQSINYTVRTQQSLVAAGL
jgi:hypothetical protein